MAHSSNLHLHGRVFSLIPSQSRRLEDLKCLDIAWTHLASRGHMNFQALEAMGQAFSTFSSISLSSDIGTTASPALQSRQKRIRRPNESSPLQALHRFSTCVYSIADRILGRVAGQFACQQ